MKLKDLAEQLGASFTGAGDLEINGIKDLEHHTPVDPSSIYYVASKKYLAKHKKASEVKVALTIESLASQFQNAIIIPEEGSKVKFIHVVSLFRKKTKIQCLDFRKSECPSHRQTW